jgi:hypothetical protein
MNRSSEMSLRLLASLVALSIVATAASPFVGTWTGSVHDLPAVELAIDGGGGQIGGTIAFYFQMLGKDGKWHVAGDKYTQPLLALRVEGSILSFEVAHHKTHGSAELGPNKKFRFELTGENEGRLREAGHDALALTRQR